MLMYGRHFRLSQLAKAASVVAASISPLSIRLLGKSPLVAFDFSTRAHEIYDELAANDPIPAVTLSQFLPGIAVEGKIWIDLSDPPGGMTTEELAYLCNLVLLWNPQVVVEIGTLRGFTTAHFSRNTAPTSRIYTVDLPAQFAKDAPFYSDSHLVRAVGTVQRVYGNDPKIHQILKDSTTIEWRDLLSSPIDFAFIDASHLYEHVRKDTEGVLKALAPNGLILWHDYRTVEVRRGVRKYLIELFRAGLPIRRLAGTTLCVYAHGLPGSLRPKEEAVAVRRGK